MPNWNPFIEELLGMQPSLRSLPLKSHGSLPGSQNELARLYFAVGNTRHHLSQLMWALEELHSRIEKSVYGGIEKDDQ